MKLKYLAVIVGIAIVIGATFFFGGFFGVSKFLNFEILKSLNTKTPSVRGESDTPKENGTIAFAPSDENSIPPRYYSLDHNFSFDAPKGFSFTDIPDAKGDVVLVEGSAGESFQVFITAFDESGPLTPERIKRDLPQKIVQDPRSATLDGTKAIAFSSREGTEDVFEVWFVHSGSLYQITTTAEFAPTLQGILQTWKFY